MFSARQLFEAFYQGRQTYQYRKGLNIPLSAQEIWVVCQGVVQLSTFDSDGSEAYLGLVYPEMPFGFSLTKIDPYEATALTDVVLIRFSQIEIENSPVLAQAVLHQLNRRLQQTEALLALINHRYVGDRLRQLLLLLQEEMGEATPEGVRIGIRLTHQQLANLVGTSRITVTRILGSFRKEGWLSIDANRHFVIHD